MTAGTLPGTPGERFARKPRERHRFDEIRIEPVRGGGFDAHARQVRGDAREQHRVVHAAAAGEHAARVRLVRAQRIGDGAAR